MSSTSVHRAMRRFGLETRPRPRPDLSAQQRLQDVAWLGERWYRDHARLSELAAEIGAAPSTIWLALVEHGIARREVTEETRARMSRSAKSRPPATPETRARRSQAQQARRARERHERRVFHIAVLMVMLDVVAQREHIHEQMRADHLAAPRQPAVIVREALDTYRRGTFSFEDGWDLALDDLEDIIGITPSWVEILSFAKPHFQSAYVGVGNPTRLSGEGETVERY